jgi:gliding motility-associated lipoprotein GldD
VACLLLLFAAACSGGAVVPKPRGYLRTDFPEKTYQTFDSAGYPYRFEYPAYARIVPDTQSHRYEPYWINMQLPDYNATLHISYKHIQNNLTELLDDTHSFTYRHGIKAETISEMPFVHEAKNVFGLLYEVDGNVASAVQFYATDSVRHFLRGSLYFMATPNIDSLMPSIAFLTADVEHLMQTMEWSPRPPKGGER